MDERFWIFVLLAAALVWSVPSWTSGQGLRYRGPYGPATAARYRSAQPRGYQPYPLNPFRSVGGTAGWTSPIYSNGFYRGGPPPLTTRRGYETSTNSLRSVLRSRRRR